MFQNLIKLVIKSYKMGKSKKIISPIYPNEKAGTGFLGFAPARNVLRNVLHSTYIRISPNDVMPSFMSSCDPKLKWIVCADTPLQPPPSTIRAVHDVPFTLEKSPNR